jgi:glucuronate isomerase
MTYLAEDFLLHSRSARILYHDFAETEPILDYHSHLSPQKIAEDASFESMTELWLRGDHYKWRLMRENGIDERLVTGPASDEETFRAWAETLPHAVRNPAYDWAHLELKRYFGISELLSPGNAPAVYAACNERLKENSFSARNLLRKMNVKTVCTTDDPTDDLSWHARLHGEPFEIQTLPTFRPDRAFAVEDPIAYNRYLDALGLAAGVDIASFDGLLAALDKRHGFFHQHGCRSADQALEVLPVMPSSATELGSIFGLIRSGKDLQEAQRAKLKTAILLELCRMNRRRGWVQMFHLGAARNLRSRLFAKLGPDAGVDCIGDAAFGRPLAGLLDLLDVDDALTKTILFNINPKDNELFACTAGAFQDGSTPGKIQLGPAWWFLDQKVGIVRHLDALSSLGLLSRFVGMTTDSRSFLSFPRHEYFRRILCGLLGAEIERGELPADMTLMGRIVKDICYRNAKEYFGY